MTDLERESTHIATAEAMLTLYGDGEHDGAGEIARHFDLGGDRSRAAAAYNRAGLHALRLRDFDLASARFGRVCELGLENDDPFLAAQALLGLGNCARGESSGTLAGTRFTQALNLARRRQLRIIEAAALACIGLVDYTAGRMSQAATGLAAAVEILIAEGDRAEHCRTLTFLSHALHGMGRYDDAMTSAREAISIGTELGDDLLAASGTTALAICWTDLGQYEVAATLYHDSIELSGRHGNTHRANVAWYNVAASEIERESWESAEAANRQVLDRARRPTLGLLGAGEFNAGCIAEGRGRFDDAARHYRRSLDYRTRNGQAALAMESRGGLLRVAIANGDRDTLRQQLNQLRTWIDAHGVEGMEHPGRIFVSLAEAHLELGKPGHARDAAREGLALITARADALADPEHRASYLNGIPTHCRLHEMADLRPPRTA